MEHGEGGGDAVTSLLSLAAEWKAEAQRLRERYGLHDLARLCETHAAELEEQVRQAADDLLTPDEAAEASGYSKRRLRELVAENKLRNAGEHGSPLYRRADLPRKRSGPPGSGDGFDAEAEVRSILGGAA